MPASPQWSFELNDIEKNHPNNECDLHASTRRIPFTDFVCCAYVLAKTWYNMTDVTMAAARRSTPQLGLGSTSTRGATAHLDVCVSISHISMIR